jgi:hypothetical protein
MLWIYQLYAWLILYSKSLRLFKLTTTSLYYCLVNVGWLSNVLPWSVNYTGWVKHENEAYHTHFKAKTFQNRYEIAKTKMLKIAVVELTSNEYCNISEWTASFLDLVSSF